MNVTLTSLCDVIVPLRSKVKHVNTASIPVSVCIFISLKTWSDTLSDIQTNNTVCKKKLGHVFIFFYSIIYFESSVKLKFQSPKLAFTPWADLISWFCFHNHYKHIINIISLLI